MKRLLTIFLSVLLILLILSSCGDKGDKAESPETKNTGDSADSGDSNNNNDRIIGIDENLCKNGELYMDNKGRLNFCDFTSLKSAILCSRPNCLHSDPQSCSAYGLGNKAVMYGDHIFGMKSEMIYYDGEPVFSTDIIRAEIDGTGRSVVKTIKDRTPKGINVLLSGDTLYFCMSKEELKDYSSTGYSEDYFCSYNFETKEYTEIAKVCDGYSAGITIIGMFNGRIYYIANYAEEKIPWEKFADPEFDLQSCMTFLSFTYSPETGEVKPFGGYPIYASSDILILSGYDSEAKTLVRRDGAEEDISFIKDFDGVVNGYLFSRTNSVALEISSGRRFSLLVDKSCKVKDYLDGEYIIKKNIMDGLDIIGREYIRLSAEELIGDEIEPESEPEPETIKWGDMDSPLFKEYAALPMDEVKAMDNEDAIKYKELLGIESRKNMNSLIRAFSGEYYLITYYISDLHSVGYVIDTNHREACKIEIKATEVNPDSGEERTLEATADCDMGGQLAVFADEGFVITSYTITNDLPSKPEKFEDKYPEAYIENELFLDKFYSMTAEEQDAYMEEIYQERFGDKANEDGG